MYPGAIEEQVELHIRLVRSGVAHGRSHEYPVSEGIDELPSWSNLLGRRMSMRFTRLTVVRHGTGPDRCEQGGVESGR